MEGIGFEPRLFCIPWFITCFARTLSILMLDVLPLHQIYRVWDFLLINNPDMTLFISYGILYQFRKRIISQDFNQNMLLISSLTDLDVEVCIRDAIVFAKITPPSLYNLDIPEDDSERTIIGSLSVSDFIEMRHYSLLIDARNHFSNDHLIGSIKLPKSVSTLKNLMQQYSKFFIVIAYQGDYPFKKLEQITRSSLICRVSLISVDQIEGIDSCFCAIHSKSAKVCVGLSN
jgi:hypothetical protein